MTAPHTGAHSWAAEPEQEFDLLVQDPPAPPPSVPQYAPVSHEDDLDRLSSGSTAVATEYTASPGIPGRGVVLVCLLAVAAAVLLDVALTSGVTMFFDLWFVVICLMAAMAVRRADLFTVGVLPPLVFAAVIAVVAVVSPSTFVDFGGYGRAFFAGLAQHAGALIAGYAIVLVTVGGRIITGRAR